MPALPRPPKQFQEFVTRFPKLAEAWETLTAAGNEGPLDEKTIRLVKLSIAMGAMREGAVHSSVRKAKAIGVTQAELEQMVALAAGTLGMPSTVAIYGWVKEEFEKNPPS